MAEPTYRLRATLLPYGQEPTDLYISGRRITLAPQEGARDLARPGGFVLAGLVDCHAHVTMDFGNKGLPPGSRELVDANRRDYLAAGVLLLRDIGAFSDVTLNLSASNGLPRLQPGGTFLAPGGGSPFPLDPVPPDRLPAVAVAQVRRGAKWVKVIADWPGGPWPPGGMPDFGRDKLNYAEDVLAETVSVVHRAGGRVAIHAFGRESTAVGVAVGVDSLEHGWGLEENMLEEMAEKRIGWTPTLAIAPVLIEGAGGARKPAVAAWVREVLARLGVLLTRARELDVPILAGTDFLPKVGSVAQEVWALHQHGLSPADALAAASSGARAFMREPDIGEGAPADLVLYDADPRDSPKVLARPSLVMLNGELVQPGPST